MIDWSKQHCGGKYSAVAYNDDLSERSYYMVCLSCGVFGPPALSSEEAIKQWDSRPYDGK